MDYRKPLPEGTVLSFPGMVCHIEAETGRGSNALVYRAWYADAHRPELRHHVLVKELFPYDPKGNLLRGKNDAILIKEDAQELFRLHCESFENANTVHLRILELRPDGVGGNLNTFSYNQTLYTVLSFDGGAALSDLPAFSFAQQIDLMEELLEALEVFHENGFLHLDISPDNILLTGNGKHRRLTLIDYNSVHSLEELSEGREMYSSTKEGFTAPEVCRGAVEKTCFASDLYSVGGVFYWLLWGHALYGELPKDPCEGLSILEEYPETVRAMVRHILIKSLFPLASRRYQSAKEMRRDILELRNRLNGVGVTHWALWESGRKSVERLLKDNPALSYVTRQEELYPVSLELQNGKQCTSLAEALSHNGNSVLLGEGGSGKTTLLLHYVHQQVRRYMPSQTAFFYIPLVNYRDENRFYIRNRLLETLKFGSETRGVEDARHQLDLLLDAPLRVCGEERAGFCLLLDGYNEAQGNRQSLLDEILLLSQKKGVKLLITSRENGEDIPFEEMRLCPLETDLVEDILQRNRLLIPQDTQMLAALRTPLILSIYIQTARQRDAQIVLQSPAELTDAYLESLYEKAIEQEEPNSPFRWQCDVAMHLLLPVLAAEMNRRGTAFSTRNMLDAVRRYWKRLHSDWMLKAFPQWIGRRKEVFSDCETAEAWFGRLVRDILWQRMGLLIRDEGENWRISHQILQETLRIKGKEIHKRCISRRRTAWIVGTCSFLLLVGLCLLQLAWSTRPYDDLLAERTIDYAGECMLQISETVQSGLAFLESPTAVSRNTLSDDLMKTQKAQESELNGTKIWLDYLEKTTESGTRVSFSGLPIREEYFRNAVELTLTIRESQQEFLTMINADGSMSDSFRQSWEGVLREAEEYAQRLYQGLLAPHLEAMKEKQPERYANYLVIVDSYEATSAALTRNISEMDATPERGNALMQELLSMQDSSQ